MVISDNLINLDVSSYQGEILHHDKRYLFRAARSEDAWDLSRLYSSVAVDKENYEDKLNSGPADFSKTGGMFIIHDGNSIRDEMKRRRSFFLTIFDTDGHAAVMLKISQTDSAFVPFLNSRVMFSGYEAECENAHAAAENGRLIFAREIIARKSGLPRPVKLMFYTAFHVLRDMGYTHSLGEIYKVLEYGDNKSLRYSGLLNERSFRAVTGAGALHIGANLTRRVTLNNTNISVCIEPQIVYFDLERVIPVLKWNLAGLGAFVSFAGGGSAYF